MSASIYVTPEGGDCEITFLASASELKQWWIPTAKRLGLHYLEYCFSAGLMLEGKGYFDTLEEMERMYAELVSMNVGQDYVETPQFRCKRAIDIIKRYPPGSNIEVYLG